jgi:hypothetical protein
VDKDLVDFVVPMCYSSKTSTVKSQVDFAIDKVGMERLVVGLGILQRSNGYDKPDDFLDRVKCVRSTYSSGLSFFSIETLRENDGIYLSMLRDDVFTDRVNPPDFLSMRESFIEFEIVKFQKDDEKFYSIKYQTGLPHRYAYLLAKDLRDYTDDVFIFNDDASYTVYVGRDTDYTYIERLSRSLTFIR